MAATKIFLIGFMGSGKTTLAPKLANKLGYPNFDLDTIIEAEKGESISSLFASQGEKKFREFEIEALKRFITENENFVLATGGGTPCFGDSINLMNSSGITIYLELSAKTLAQRIIPAKNNRPLLANLSDDELVEFIEKKLAERSSHYKKSLIKIDGLSVKIDALTDIIQRYSK